MSYNKRVHIFWQIIFNLTGGFQLHFNIIFYLCIKTLKNTKLTITFSLAKHLTFYTFYFFFSILIFIHYIFFYWCHIKQIFNVLGITVYPLHIVLKYQFTYCRNMYSFLVYVLCMSLLFFIVAIVIFVVVGVDAVNFSVLACNRLFVLFGFFHHFFLSNHFFFSMKFWTQ